MSRVLIFYLYSLTLRSLILAGLAGLLLLRTRSAALRHAVWTVVLACIVLMPLADALLPPTVIPTPAPQIILPIILPIQAFVIGPQPARGFDTATTAAVPVDPGIDWWKICNFAVAIISVGFLSRLLLMFHKVRRIKRLGEPIANAVWDELKSSPNVSLQESCWTTVPVTVGFWKPSVILPAGWRSWDEWKLRTVLVHELTHIQRRDWAIAVTAAAAKSLFWFNPLTWWLEQKLSSLGELASDEACVRSSGDPQRYAETLLEFAAAAKQGQRWIGGVAMAQHKISKRIERVLALERPGSGIVSRAGWLLLVTLTLPALYAAAAARFGPAPLPISPAGIVQRLQQQPIPAPDVVALTVPEQARAQEPPTPAAPTASPQPQQPAPSPAPAVAVPTNPDLVGEIKLILAPVDKPLDKPFDDTVWITTQGTTNRFTGTAVWNVQNSALSPNTWGRAVNTKQFVFALTGVQDRKMQFESAAGGSFSYGCADCSFVVWESGIGLPTATTSPGVLFQLSADGKSVSATCRATECQVGTGFGFTPTFQLGRTFYSLSAVLHNSESQSFALLQSPANSPSRLVCFSVFGTVRADGTPFTDADCPAGRPTLPTTVVFAVTR